MRSNGEDHGLSAIRAVYWQAYGGWKAVFHSQFFWSSIVLLVLTANFWVAHDWWEQVLSVIPNLLGFTLGGFAIFLGFGDEKFKRLIAGEDEDLPGQASPYMEICSAFLHFVVVQCLALIVAILAKAASFEMPWHPHGFFLWLLHGYRWILGLVGYWLFLYGICLAFAAAVGIYRVAFWFDKYQTVHRDDN
nr:MAG TPA: hypothetical protein [Caudoviricetes sp.]